MAMPLAGPAAEWVIPANPKLVAAMVANNIARM
jgi:hypothetical protein